MQQDQAPEDATLGGLIAVVEYFIGTLQDEMSRLAKRGQSTEMLRLLRDVEAAGARRHALLRLDGLKDFGPTLRSDPVLVVNHARFVLIRVASAAIGLSPKAIRRKIEEGVWIEGYQYRRGPDGHVYVDMESVQQWLLRDASRDPNRRKMGRAAT